MVELIAAIILVLSLIGMGTILVRKMPFLVELPDELPEERAIQETLILKLKKKVKNISFLKPAFFEKFLQKLLSKIRVLILRIENKIGIRLQRMRERAQKNKGNDNYWEEIKKSTDREDKDLPG